MGETREFSYRLVVPIVGHRHPVARAADIDAGGVQMDLSENLLLLSSALLCLTSFSLRHGGAPWGSWVKHPRAGMCRGSSLLNGVTPIVPPVRLSPHPRTKLLDGDWPPVVRRPRPSGARPAYRQAPSGRIRFSAQRGVAAARVKSS